MTKRAPPIFFRLIECMIRSSPAEPLFVHHVRRIRFLARLCARKHLTLKFAFGLEPIVQLTA
jgi:hypothetical protein